MSILCTTCLSLMMLFQDPAYSADSLMAAFERGLRVSLKGSEITTIAVVAAVVTLLALLRLLSRRFRAGAGTRNRDGVRRAALEALLMAEKKKQRRMRA